MTPDLKPYVTLLTALVSRRIGPAEFQDVIVPLFKNDRSWRPEDVYEIINNIFLAAEAFDPDASGGDPYAVTEDELYRVAETGLRRLTDVVDPS